MTKATEEKKIPCKPSKIGTFTGIKSVQLFEVQCEFYQDSDSCQEGEPGQEIKIYTQDAGCGSYIVIETSRWAIDVDDIDKFAACLKRIVNLPEEDKDG